MSLQTDMTHILIIALPPPMTQWKTFSSVNIFCWDYWKKVHKNVKYGWDFLVERLYAQRYQIKGASIWDEIDIHDLTLCYYMLVVDNTAKARDTYP